ncbi:MAG: aminotransferase class I/II-fold pyridoxal phosphate-dependent enzyme, partial [bacterium]
MKISDFKLERYFAAHEFNAPYLLCCSACESFTIEDILQFENDACENFMRLGLGYTESPGHPALREAIAGLYANMNAEQILVHSGAEEAIFSFMQVALNRGDHLIVHSPCYQSLYEVARASGCDVTPWPAEENTGWALDIDFLLRAIKKNTKAIAINCPHNPTGYLMPKAQLQQIIEIARSHSLYLFSDEVYRLLEYEPANRLPAACDLFEKAVSLGVMSKAFGLAGLRIGWIATQDRALFEKMSAFKDYTTICNSAPSEFLAAIALRNQDRILQRNLQIIRKNLALLNGFFQRHKNIFAWQPPRAGCIAFPRLKIDQDVENFCAELLEQAGVLLLPASMYGYGDKHFRIGFSRINMPEALAALD